MKQFAETTQHAMKQFAKTQTQQSSLRKPKRNNEAICESQRAMPNRNEAACKKPNATKQFAKVNAQCSPRKPSATTRNEALCENRSATKQFANTKAQRSSLRNQSATKQFAKTTQHAMKQFAKTQTQRSSLRKPKRNNEAICESQRAMPSRNEAVCKKPNAAVLDSLSSCEILSQLSKRKAKRFDSCDRMSQDDSESRTAASVWYANFISGDGSTCYLPAPANSALSRQTHALPTVEDAC